jgi:hypothetical protein
MQPKLISINVFYNSYLDTWESVGNFSPKRNQPFYDEQLPIIRYRLKEILETWLAFLEENPNYDCGGRPYVEEE